GRRSRYGRTLGYLPRETRAVHGGHVELWAGSALLWEGRVTKRHRPGGRVTAIAAVGYKTALADNPFLSTSETTMTSGDLIRMAVAQSAPLVRVGAGERFVDPQVPHAPVEMDGLTPAAIIEQVVREGGDSVTWDWAVWRGRVL